MTDAVIDKALAAQGVTDPADADLGSIDTVGNPAPPAAVNTPPATPPAEEPPAEEPPATPAEETPEAETSTDAALDTDVWGTTGDAVGDSVLVLLQNAGVTPDEAKALLFDAMKSGDVLKVDRAALAAKVGDAKATLILAGAENFATRAANTANTILTEVQSAVGGEANWKAVAGWAAKAFTPDQIGEYKTLIDNGGAQARFAAQEMVQKYNADAKNTTLDASKAEITPDARPPSSARSITRNEYSAEMSKAHSSGNYAALNEIQQARERGRAAGI